MEEDDYYDGDGDYPWRDLMYCPSCDLFIDEEYEYAPRPLPSSPFVPYCLQCGAITHEIRCLQDFHGEWLPQDSFEADYPYPPY